MVGGLMLNRFKPYLLFFALLLVAACSKEQEPTQTDEPGYSEADAQFVDDTAAYLERLEKLGFSGGVKINRGERTLLQAGYGFADREDETPWSESTVSTTGSITKQFTGAAVLLLQEDGLLSVDDLITKYFDGVPEDKQAITLHQLLTHSSGIIELEGSSDSDPIEFDTYLKGVMAQPLEFEPGTSFAYSNTGYSLLAAIIEQITGTSYERFLRKRLFLPAGMTDTGYIYPAWDDARIAIGYDADERWGTVLERSVEEDGPYWALRGNGGIHSTTTDMVAWANALMSGAVMSEQSMEAYWAPHVDEGFGDSFYSYGWVVMQGPGDRHMITHNGGNTIFFADMAIFPDDNIVIVLQTNVVTDWPFAAQLLETISLRLFDGEDYPLVPDRVDSGADALTAFAGNYVSGEGEQKLEYVVSSVGSELLVLPGNPVSFSYMHSTRDVDPERCERLSNRIAEIVAAYVEQDDLLPLFNAYGGIAPLEVLEQGWATRKQRQQEEYGALVGFSILGTAMRDGRDVTLVRHEFEFGHADTAFVWDPEMEEHLLGRSGRGLDPVLRFVPTGEETFGSWDGGFSDSRSLRFDGDSLTLAGAAADVIVGRVR